MGPAHWPCKVDIQLPTPPITAYNSFILRESCLIHAMRMPYSPLNQYHPGTFGCSVVHVMARGRAFHNAAASSLEPRSLVVKHPRVQYADQPIATCPLPSLSNESKMSASSPHTGHGSNLSIENSYFGSRGVGRGVQCVKYPSSTQSSSRGEPTYGGPSSGNLHHRASP